MKHDINLFAFGLAVLISGTTVAHANSDRDIAANTEYFERSVRPVLIERCIKCHGPNKQEAGLRLDSRDAVMRGSDEGAVVQTGDPEASTLVRAIRYGADLKMPPDGRLSPKDIVALERWIKIGLPWPAATARPSADHTATARDHWAFQPIRNPTVPPLTGEAWPRTDIDRFVLARLKTAGLTPASQATDER